MTDAPQHLVQYEPTPNPDALKCILGRPLPALTPAHPGRRSYDRNRPEDLAGLPAQDPFAAAILALPGVQGVLIHESGRWLTIRRAPTSAAPTSAAWAPIKQGLERLLAAAASSAPPTPHPHDSQAHP